MNKLPVALLGLVTLGTSAALADEGLGIGASVGYVNIEDSEPGFDFDASDTGYKLFANYEFANHLAIEGGYVDFGKPEDVVLGLPGEIDASGWNLYGVGNLPLSGGVDLFAKAGIVSWEADSIIDFLRTLGLVVFTIPFNTFDGLGDGPFIGEVPPTVFGSAQTRPSF